MIKKQIREVLEEYLEAPEAWSDNVQVEVNPATLEVRLNDDEDIDEEASEMDYWPVMDLLSMSIETPGEWEIDEDALCEMAENYCSN